MLSRRGVSLPELLVALTVFAVVATANFQTLLTASRWFRRTALVAEREGQLAAVAQVVAALASSASTVDGDVSVSSDSVLVWRGLLGVGVVCRVDLGEAVVPRTTLASRVQLGGFPSLPQAGDLAVVWSEGATPVAADDRWDAHRITAARSGVGQCVGGLLADSVRDAAAPVLRLTLQPPLDSSHAGAPIQVLRGRRLALYRSGAEGALGLAEASGASTWTVMQPVAGPLALPSTLPPGLELPLVDSLFQRSSSARQAMQFVVRAPSARPLTAVGAALDSAQRWIAFRNRR